MLLPGSGWVLSFRAWAVRETEFSGGGWDSLVYKRDQEDNRLISPRDVGRKAKAEFP